MEFVGCKEFRGVKTYMLKETIPHPEGSDRGGSATEKYVFKIEGNKVTHEYTVDVDEPQSFGITQLDLTSRLMAKELLDNHREMLLNHVAEIDELLANLSEMEYEDISEYDED